MSSKRAQLIQLWKRYKGICYLCGKAVKLSDATRDHKVPKSLWGYNHIENLALAHKNCNHLRGSIPVEEFRVLLHQGDLEEIRRRNREINDSVKEIEQQELEYFRYRSIDE